jgi:hypothetical protein
VGLAHEELGISDMIKSKKIPILNCIDKYLTSHPLENDPALSIINLGASGKKDISAKHDDYLVDSHFATAGFATSP